MDNTLYQSDLLDVLDRNMTLEAYSELIQLRGENKELTKESLINILDNNMTAEAYSELISLKEMKVSSEELEDTSSENEVTSEKYGDTSDKKSIFKRIISIIKGLFERRQHM